MGVVERAREAREWFELAERADSGEKFWRVKQDAPGWVSALCLAAHGNGEILPDDYRYEMIAEALDVLSDAPDDADVQDLLGQVEAPIYTSELTRWLASRVGRIVYLDEVLEEWSGEVREGWRLLSWAWTYEFRETAAAVVAALEAGAPDEVTA